MSRIQALLIWAALALVLLVPLSAALLSPLLAWRGPVYILAGIAGVVAMGLLLVQPLLAAGFLPSFEGWRGRKMHRRTGLALVCAVVLHVGGLWITSPPDAIDALLFRSPTPFSDWGVIAMWATFLAALLVAVRHRLRLAPPRWRLVHVALALVTVIGSVIHALLIEGTMEPLTKAGLCILVLAATVAAIARSRSRLRRPSRRSSN